MPTSFMNRSLTNSSLLEFLLCVSVFLAANTQTASGQGLVLLSNLDSIGKVDAPVYDDGGKLLVGDQFKAQLYVGISRNTLFPTSPITSFGKGAGAGYFNPELIEVSGIAASENVYAQVRVWDSNNAPTYEAALVMPGGRTGKSEILQVVTGGAGFPPTSPAPLTGLKEFSLVKNPVNIPPTISKIAPQCASPGSTIGPIRFTVKDARTNENDLTLSGNSSNQALVPADAITFGGTGQNRMITLKPTSDQIGEATITVLVTDTEGITTEESFQLFVDLPVCAAPVNGLVSWWPGEGMANDVSGGNQTSSGRALP